MPKKVEPANKIAVKKTKKKAEAVVKKTSKVVAPEKASGIAAGVSVKTAKKDKAVGQLRVTQVKSFIGRKENQELSLRALGLGRIGKSRVLPDIPETKGLINRVKHLITVEVV